MTEVVPGEMTEEMTRHTDEPDRWADRLSDYLDGELAPEETQALEMHLVECEACTDALDGLRSIVARARRLDPSAPPRDLWPEIAARIGAETTGRAGTEPGRTAAAPRSRGAEADASDVGTLSLAEARRRKERRRRRLFTLSLPQLSAAAVALMLLSGGAVWIAGFGDRTGPDGGHAGAAGPSPGAFPAIATGGVGARGSTLARYQAAIAELEQAIFDGGEPLDTATVRKIRSSLETIDRAIAEARSALEDDPSDPYVNQHLAETMRSKVDFLKQTAVLAVARG